MERGGAGSPTAPPLPRALATYAQFIVGRLGQIFQDWRADITRAEQQHPPARGGHCGDPYAPWDGGGDACSLHPGEEEGAGGQPPLEYR